MKRVSLAAEITFFFLTLLAVAAFWFFCSELDLAKGWLTLIFSISLAELLMWRYQFRRTGVESALWIGGLLGFIFALPHSGKPEAILVIAAAFAIAGARLRIAVFGVIAIVVTFQYLGARHLEFEAMLCGAAVSVIASFLASRPLFAYTAVVAPIAGYVVYAGTRTAAVPAIALLFAAAAIADLWIGIRLRERAALVATSVCVALACFEVRDLLHVATETKLIIAGVTMLAVATALMRLLRHRTTGIVVTPTAPHELQEALQMTVMLPMATPDAGPDAPRPVGGGGEFGGAGASGQY